MNKHAENYLQKVDLQVASSLVDFVENEVLPGLDISASGFWQSLSGVVNELTPQNIALLEERDELQAKLDVWNAAHKDSFSPSDYKKFLQEIGYLVPEGSEFKISTENVDDEIARQAGPQLVVPTSNARFALNATNARWGSLYDALYGTDAIPSDHGAQATGAYNPLRGDKVIAFGRAFLDEHFPIVGSDGRQMSHVSALAYTIQTSSSGAYVLHIGTQAGNAGLETPAKFIGFQGAPENPSSILLTHNGLRVAIEIDPTSAIGATDKAGVKDLTMEAALTTIQDFEDSVAAVDAQDKIGVYRNWLGLMKGDLEESFQKGGKAMTRALANDKTYVGTDGHDLVLHGRSLLFCRNVGHLMSNPAIIDANGREIQEGIMDAMFSSTIALHDLKGSNTRKNSRTGSVYIVKPKMHGPKEAAFANTLFDRVEDELGLARHSLKIGVMDEERRTTVNLKECIRAVKDRVVFINTGFLDRTGDEIHTSMLLGPMTTKAGIKQQAWIKAYENWNVDIGLECGLSGRAQIGKGMWAMPDEMAQMLVEKIGHPKSGANTAWVPSPIGATLHSTHYHQVNVFDVQKDLAKRARASLDDILTIPLKAKDQNFSADEVQRELDNNAQGILGYVVRWIDQGVGCSKVPDINNVGLMEDRATLRISSQHLANWLEHGITTEVAIRDTFKRMAAIVDEQNAHDPVYVPMCKNLEESIAYQAALALVFKGKEQPSGYTEPLLHQYRLALKASM
ncbi:MAG TPA: malate synthase G [Gammaproteobacteria bacterium]|nr:malate synthase G [Gammaproteobacteria bacterium]